jgi:hypothetical protein
MRGIKRWLAHLLRALMVVAVQVLLLLTVR